jgi:hypothetical protein
MSKVYVYESCEPLVKVTNKLTQIIQTERVEFTFTVGTIFKDNVGKCWNFIGEYESDYIATPDVFSVNFTGNYFNKNKKISANIFPTYDDCLTTNLSACTEVFYLAKRCDSGTTVNVKICNVGPLNGNIKLLPTIGQICGVNNPEGDDFCVVLESQVAGIETNHEIITPAWQEYDCENCPSLKSYVANSCDGNVTGVTIFDYSSSNTLSASTVVRSYKDGQCYEIISYDGIKIVYGFTLSNSLFVSQVFENCENCVLNNLKTS